MFKKTESWEDEMICPVAKSHSVTEPDLHLHPPALNLFPKYSVDQKVPLDFSVRCYGKNLNELFGQLNTHTWASLVAQWYGTRLPMQEKWVRSLGQEDLLEKEMATHSNILAWKTPWTEEPGGLSWRAMVHGVAKRQTQLSD